MDMFFSVGTIAVTILRMFIEAEISQKHFYLSTEYMRGGVSKD